MKFTIIRSMVGLVLGLGLTVSAGLAQEGSATPEEVVSKVQAAARFLHEKGAAGFADFNWKNNKWVWKDSYVFVYNCRRNTMIAHPLRPDLVGKPLLQIRDNNNKPIFKELCKAGEKPHGGWVEYVWPKPGEGGVSRKISYALAADISFEYGTQVAAGIYDEEASVEELSELLERIYNPERYPVL
ncbi:MAG: cache domain-containing protein [Gammaproteobacteria bacterium]